MSEQTRFDNGLDPDNQIEEGTDGLVLTDEVLDAYARYFGAFIDAYRERGIDISMVMPQNEFNSAQIYPACTWTPEGLVKFLRRLIPEMERRGVDVFFGTMERPDDSMVEKVLADPQVGPKIGGVGSSGTASGPCPSSTTPTPDSGSTRPSRSAATGATTGATPATPGR